MFCFGKQSQSLSCYANFLLKQILLRAPLVNPDPREHHIWQAIVLFVCSDEFAFYASKNFSLLKRVFVLFFRLGQLMSLWVKKVMKAGLFCQHKKTPVITSQFTQSWRAAHLRVAITITFLGRNLQQIVLRFQIWGFSRKGYWWHDINFDFEK